MAKSNLLEPLFIPQTQTMLDQISPWLVQATSWKWTRKETAFQCGPFQPPDLLNRERLHIFCRVIYNKPPKFYETCGSGMDWAEYLLSYYTRPKGGTYSRSTQLRQVPRSSKSRRNLGTTYRSWSETRTQIFYACGRKRQLTFLIICD